MFDMCAISDMTCQSSPGSKGGISVDSSLMEPFKANASSVQKQSTHNALFNHTDDVSLSSSIHFDPSPNKVARNHNSAHQMTFSTQFNSTIEAAVLMVRNVDCFQ